MLTRVLLVLEGAERRKRIRNFLQDHRDMALQTVRAKRPVWNKCIAQPVDVIVVDRDLLSAEPTESFEPWRALPQPPRIIVMTTNEETEDRGKLLALGCTAVIDLSLDDELLREALTSVILRGSEDHSDEIATRIQLETPRLGDFVSRSASMQRFLEIVKRVLAADTTILINGETGVGKERLARAIHAEGPRGHGPFVTVNCGAIPESLLESELFGHEAGAFTGATRSRRGWFELAHNGTIFLDEIGEMPAHLQVKLLQVLQSRYVVPVGSETSVHVDVRVMAATNRVLEADVQDKLFRADLYYRLAVLKLEIPPLRERREDIPELATRFLNYYQSRFATTVKSISDEAMHAMTEYSWPGNVRELMNVIERALLLGPHAEMGLEDLPSAFASDRNEVSAPAESRANESELPLPDNWDRLPLKELRRLVGHQLEKKYLQTILESTGGRIAETARRVGVNERNLFEKMRTHGLKKEDFKQT